MCFAQADRRRNLGRDLVRQRMKNRGDEGKCKAAASRLRKIRRAPAERIPLTPCPEHAKPRSNASFETKHHPPAAFQELPSFTKRRSMNAILREQNRASWRELAQCAEDSAPYSTWSDAQVLFLAAWSLSFVSIVRELRSRVLRRATGRKNC
jgi:hypothetical protein